MRLRLSRVLAMFTSIAALLMLLAAPAPAAPVGPPIQPGAAITMNGSYCTLNWIYEGIGVRAGKVYAGTAAHCVEGVGQQVSLATTSVGMPIEPIGKVAFVGNADEPGRDYAFIEIEADDVKQVSPAMAGHPDIPSRVSTNPRRGNLMQFSGHGVGFNLLPLTRQSRVGVLNAFDEREHQITGGVTFGDSGGPVANITEGNTAFGIVSTAGLGVAFPSLTVVQAGEGGANLAFVLEDASRRGFAVKLCAVGQACGS